MNGARLNGSPLITIMQRMSPELRFRPARPLSLQKVLLAVTIFAASILPAAGEVEIIPEVGAHHPILTVAKNVNPQNLMVVYTKTDADGRFLTSHAARHRPLVDFYWLMNGKNYKPVNRLIKNEIRKRFECASNTATHFVIEIDDLKEVKTDIRDPKVDVYVSGAGSSCKVETQMNLGPSDGNMRIQLMSIYTEGRAFPPAVYAVTLKGEEIVDGKPTGNKVTRRYDAKGG